MASEQPQSLSQDQNGSGSEPATAPAQDPASSSPGLIPNPDVKPKQPKAAKKSKKTKKGKQTTAAEADAERLAKAIENNEELPKPAKKQPPPPPPPASEATVQDSKPPPNAAAVPGVVTYDREAVEIALSLCQQVFKEAASIQKPKPVGQYPTLGLTPADRKEAQKMLFPALIHLEYQELVELMRRLWLKPEREYQYLVLDLLKHATVTILRSSGHDALFALLYFCISTKPMRDTVDELATKHLTTLAYLEPSHTWRHMDRWIDDPDPWVQRAVVLHQHGCGDFTDRVRLQRFCEQALKVTGENAPILEDAVEEALGRFANTYHIGQTPSGAEFAVRLITSKLPEMTPNLATKMKALRETLENKIRTLKRSQHSR